MPFAIAGGVIAAAGSIYGASQAGDAAQQAAQTQANAAQNATNTQLQIYNQQQQLLAPYVQAGYGASNELNYLLGIPGYNTPSSGQTMGQYTNPNNLPVNPQTGKPYDLNYFLQYDQGINPNPQGAFRDAQTQYNEYLAGNLGALGGNAGAVWGGKPPVAPGQGGQPQAATAGGPIPLSAAGGPAGGFQAGLAGPTGANVAGGGGAAQGGFGSLTTPFSAAQFQQSPGYQFSLQQGLNAINANAAAQGRSFSPGTSAALGQYAVGTADQEYQQALQNYMAQQQQTYGMLSGVAGSGQNAAVQTGAFGGQAGSNLSSLQVGTGNALAAGQIGQANAYAGGATGVANALTNPYLLQSIYGQNNYSGPGAPGYSTGQALGNYFNSPDPSSVYAAS